jgi:tRNA-dihydrouridine synthase
MTKPNKLVDIVSSLTKNLSRTVTVKIRTGWDTNSPNAHKIVPLLQKTSKGRISAIFIHGRSRLQRYAKTANWDYILGLSMYLSIYLSI